MARRKRRKIDARAAPGFRPDPAIPPLRVVVMALENSLVVQDLVDGFRAAGHQVMQLPFRTSGGLQNQVAFHGAERGFGPLIDRILKFGPHLILNPNGAGLQFNSVFPGLAEAERIPLVVWFVDTPSMCLPRLVPPGSEFNLMLSYDLSHVATLRGMGYGHVEYLPLGTDPRKFPAPAGPGHVEAEFAAGYVGNLFTTQLTLGKQTLERLARDFPSDDRAAFEQLLEEGVKPFSRLGQLDETPWQWLERTAAGRLSDPEKQLRAAAHYLAPMIGHGAAAAQRRRLARELDRLGLHVWGDAAWRDTIDPERCHPPLPYEKLHTVYGRCGVNLSVSHVQNVNSVTQRHFDVPACGGFLLSDWRACMGDLFDVGEELVAFHSFEEARALAERYVGDGAERRRIAERARRRVLAEHTYVHRVEALARLVLERWPEVAARPRRRKSVVLTSPPEVAAPTLARVASELLEAGLESPAQPVLEALAREDAPACQAAAARLEGDRALFALDPQRALELYRRAIELGDADNDVTQFFAGRACLETEGVAAATPHFQRAAELRHDDPVCWTTVAGCYLELKDWPQARRALERALSLDPHYAPAVQARENFKAQLEEARAAAEDGEPDADPGPRESEGREAPQSPTRS